MMRDDLIQMTQARRLRVTQAALVSLLTLGAGTLAHAQVGQKIVLPAGLSQSAVSQITELETEKASRTPAQNKMDSQLIYAGQQMMGTEKASAIRNLQVNVGLDSEGGVLVDVDGTVSPGLLKQIINLGGEVVSSFPQYNTLRAKMPLGSIEALAASPAVRFIKPAAQPELEGQPAGPMHPVPMVPTVSRAQRDARLKAMLPGLIKQAQANRAAARSASSLTGFSPMGTLLGTPALFQMRDGLMAQFALKPFHLNVAAAPGSGSVDTEGDATHRAITARTQFGADGTAIRVGVLSDSIDDTSGSYAAAVASGDVSPVTVLPGQAGLGAGEGLAMLEIVHDLAPGAQLYFASAFNGAASFAQNIRDLRSAGCDIIIDDVSYSNESPFQDDLISQSVAAVTASGALYFSSASNSGSVRAKTSGTWEGDFNDGGPAAAPITDPSGKGYRLHLFTGTNQLTGAFLSQTYNAFSPAPTGSSRRGELFWADPLGASTNDYDLFYLSADGTTVLKSSTTSQNGTQDPYEAFSIPDAESPFANKRFVVVKAASAAPRFLHFDTGRGYITVSTNGVTRGHSAVPAAFSTAATPAGAPADPGAAAGRIPAVTGPYPGAFSAANTTEGFSSDGPRRVFYNVDGTPITPGNLSSSGGTVRLKPDITAADGVSTTLPSGSGLNPFYGTSAAAPHAGAIAALLKSYNVTLTPPQVRSIFTGTAIDIDTPGYDVTAGYGIVDAVNVLSATTPVPAEFLDFTVDTNTVHGGQVITGTVSIKDPAPAGGATFALATTNTGAAFIPASVTIPQGQTSASFQVKTQLVTVTQTTNITATYQTQVRGRLITVQAQYNISGRVLAAANGSGIPGALVSTQTLGDTSPTSLTNTPATPIAIPDGTASGSGAPVRLPITFAASGLVSSISVGLDITHTFRGDLLIALFAPDGTYVILKNPSADGTHDYKTTIPIPTPSDNPLSTLFGKPLKGTWTLYVQDTGPLDVGTLNSFSLNLTPAATTADSSGAYLFSNTAAATYPLTASAGSGYLPATRIVTVGPDAAGQDFALATAAIRSSASVTRTANDYTVTLNLSSGVAASNVVLTKASLGAAALPTTPALPVTVGTIPANGSSTVVLHFPLSAGAAGTTVLLRDSGTNTGGSFSGSFAVKLPAPTTF